MSTFQDLIEYFATPDQPFDFNLEPLLCADEYSAGLIQDGIRLFILPIIRRRLMSYFRNVIDIRGNACPNLVNMRAQNDNGTDSSFRTTRFYSDLVSYGLRSPDACVYAQCIVPLSSADNQGHSGQALGPDTERPESPSDTPSATSMEDKFSTHQNNEQIYLVPSLVGELKGLETRFEMCVCQGLSYLLTAHEAVGCFLGFIVHGKRYAICLAMSPDLILFHDASADAQGVNDPITLDDYLERHKTFPQSYAALDPTTGLPSLQQNEADLRRIWRIFWDATSMLLPRRTDVPLRRLEAPNGRLTQIFRTVARVAPLASHRFAVAIRPGVREYFGDRGVPTGAERDDEDDEHDEDDRGPPRTPLEAQTVPSTISEVQDLDMEMTFVSNLQPTEVRDAPAPLHVLQKSDLPVPGWEDYPLDPEYEEDEEAVQAQTERDLNFLAQRAHLRSKGQFLVPVGSQVFDALLNEVHEHAVGLMPTF
ncbi:hypothetical protein IAU59_001845 [Kwoniella sp. CBS 9459]